MSWERGKGKYVDVMGKLRVKWLTKDVGFRVGSGFSDDQRQHAQELFPKGTIVKYFEISNKGVPRFPGRKRPRRGQIALAVPEICDGGGGRIETVQC